LFRNFDYIKKFKSFKKLTHKTVEKINNSNSDSDKLLIVKNWINDINHIVQKKPNTRVFLYDQAVNLCQQDNMWQKVFSPFKMIIVVRDLKDSISEVYHSRHLDRIFGYFNSYIYGDSKEDKINFIIEYYDRISECISKYSDMNNILLIKFEDFVMNFNNSSKLIAEFVGVKFSIPDINIFNPNLSKLNINLNHDFLNRDQLSKIEEINERLNNLVLS
jgi:hypothetical protein